ncbi:MAG: DJ-1/PfpI family protein [Bacteroidia bacterium]
MSGSISFSCNQTHKQKIPQIEKPDRVLNVGILIMEGVYNTELTAPMDILHHTVFHTEHGMKVFTIADSIHPITTFEGLRITPDYGYMNDSFPAIDVLVVPSAEHHLDTDLENKTMIQFVRETGEKALYVMSLCDGAFVLAKSGLLDQSESTTFPGDIEKYKQTFPHLTVHQNVLFVHDGKFITSAGGQNLLSSPYIWLKCSMGKKLLTALPEGW